jgi:hypothetical protein
MCRQQTSRSRLGSSDMRGTRDLQVITIKLEGIQLITGLGERPGSA